MGQPERMDVQDGWSVETFLDKSFHAFTVLGPRVAPSLRGLQPL